ncbi:hypothetical protein CEXT_5741 [Caerostris extrusa]|uniref:Uncharacterized protein n=1 Tax=Caerostris extrusa TaxID=172846 RepID=A0AAV4UXT7_CAEEX|nr:hypothetical protein CEXT_5741 [Caerostris extrusa]
MYKRQFLSPNAEPHGPPVQNQKPRRPIRLFTDSYDSAVDKHLEEKGEKRHGVSEKFLIVHHMILQKAFIQEEASQEHSQWESGEISPLYPAKINRQQQILGPPEDEFRSPRQIQTGETFSSSPEQQSNLPSQSHFRNGFQYPKESPRSALNADKLINKDLNKQFKNNFNKGPSDGDDFDLNSRPLGRQSAPQSQNSYGMLESFNNEEDLRGRSQSNLQAPYPPTLQRPVLKMEDARTLPQILEDQSQLHLDRTTFHTNDQNQRNIFHYYLSEQPPVSHRASQDTDPAFPLTPADHRNKKNHERFEHPHKVSSKYPDDDITSYRQTNRNPINTYTQSLKDDQTHKYIESPHKQNERHRDLPNYPEEALNYGGLPLNQKINPQISQQESMLSSLKGQQAEFQGYSVDKNNPQPDKYYPSQNYDHPNSRVKHSVEQVKPRNVTARNQAQDHIIGMGSETELDAEPADNDDVFDDEEKHDGFLDMGAYTDKQGSFGWYADFPVGRGHDKVSYSSS